jgi:hypothetical protein
MGGLVIDIYVEFIFRAVVLLFRTHRAKSWPVVQAEVTATHHRPGGYGCDVVDVTYQYRVEEELHTGMHEKPFLWDSTAQEYMEQHSPGRALLVRVRPGASEVSIVRDHDAYLHAHCYPPRELAS